MFFVGLLLMGFQIHVRRCCLFQELGYQFFVILWGGMCFLGGDFLGVYMCLTALNCRR